MKQLSRVVILSFVFSALLAGTLISATPPAGLWKGKIKIPGSSLGIEVSLDRSDEGVWLGKIDIPAQGLRGFALANVEVGEVEVAFAMQGIPGTPTFKGLYSDAEQRIAGSFTQGGQSMEFELKFSPEVAEDSPPNVAEKGIPGEGVVGEWFGTLTVGPASLRLALHVSTDKEGALSGGLHSLDQGPDEMKIDEVTFVEETLTYAIRRIDGSYTGVLNADGSELSGTWMQRGRSIPLVFRRVAKRVALNRPQEPKGPFSYEECEIRFRNEVDGLTFAGTFVVPEGEAPFPTVVFFTGSGPQDRDETLMGHRPFAVIADALARRGIASLRFDDRGVGGSEGDLMDSEVTSFANDAIAAIRFLETREEVDQDRLGFIGHSEGGLVGPMAAVQDEQLDFLVLLAPPGEALDKLLVRQSGDALRLRGVDEELVQRLQADTAKDMELIKDSSLSREELIVALRERGEMARASYEAGTLEALGLNEQVIESSILSVSTKWFRSLMSIDPVTYLDEVTVPTLALFGEKDVQVAAKVNAAIVQESFERSGNDRAVAQIQENLNHLFQNCDTGSIAEYGQIEETFDTATLQLIGDWVLAQ